MKRTILSGGLLILALQVFGCGGNIPDAPQITRQSENTANLQTGSNTSDSNSQAFNTQENTVQETVPPAPSANNSYPAPATRGFNQLPAPEQTAQPAQRTIIVKKYIKPKRRF